MFLNLSQHKTSKPHLGLNSYANILIKTVDNKYSRRSKKKNSETQNLWTRQYKIEILTHIVVVCQNLNSIYIPPLNITQTEYELM